MNLTQSIESLKNETGGEWHPQDGDTGCSRLLSPSQQLTTIQEQDTTETILQQKGKVETVPWTRVQNTLYYN